MDEFCPTPKSISYKQLNSLLTNARKQPVNFQEPTNIISKEQKAFNELITDWQNLSQELLNQLSTKHNYLVEERSSQSIMALGALEAHLKMAIHAKQASDLN